MSRLAEASSQEAQDSSRPQPAAPSLKQKTVSGVKWQVANKVLQKVISVISFAVLARILEPSTFGLFAMAFIAIDGFQIFRAFGVDAALIQRKDSSEDASHTAFWIIQATGVALCLFCYLIAPVIGNFFHHESLASITRALGVIFIFGCLGRIPNSLLTKQMKFNLIAIIELSGALVNSVLAVTFALISPSVWSLVAAYIGKQVVMSLMSWKLSAYRVKFVFNKQIAKELLGFGKFMTGLGIVWYINSNMNNLLVGKMLGAAGLGYFALASNIGNFINTHFVQLLGTAMFPAYSKIQGDVSQVGRAYLKSLRYVAILSFPFAVSLICLSDTLVLALYGDKWLQVIPLLQLFGVLQFFIPMMACSSPVFLGLGKANQSFYLNIISLVIRTPLLIVMIYYFKLPGAVLAWLLATMVILPLNTAWLKKLVQVSYTDMFREIGVACGCSVVMGLFIAVIRKWVSFSGFPLEHVLDFTVLSLLGCCVYFIIMSIFDRASLVEVRKLIFKERRA